MQKGKNEEKEEGMLGERIAIDQEKRKKEEEIIRRNMEKRGTAKIRQKTEE